MQKRKTPTYEAIRILGTLRRPQTRPSKNISLVYLAPLGDRWLQIPFEGIFFNVTSICISIGLSVKISFILYVYIHIKNYFFFCLWEYRINEIFTDSPKYLSMFFFIIIFLVGCSEITFKKDTPKFQSYAGT